MPLVLHRGNDRRAKEAGFTLVELGVVVVMMGVLAAVLLPALAGAKEKSKRAICQSNVRQLLYVLDIYAFDNEDWLPSSSDNLGYYHSIRLSDQTFTNLMALTVTSNIFYCPNVVGGGNGNIALHDSLGYVIGYNYLANAVQTTQKGNDSWVSPRKVTDLPSSELIADPNFWVKSTSTDPAFPPGLKIAPHGATGAVIVRKALPVTAGASQPSDSAGIGAVGGNIGCLDSSVRWRNINQMQTWSASSSQYSFGNW
jgi:type II secretory pathway pseudopilin PulG